MRGVLLRLVAAALLELFAIQAVLPKWEPKPPPALRPLLERSLPLAPSRAVCIPPFPERRLPPAPSCNSPPNCVRNRVTSVVDRFCTTAIAGAISHCRKA